MSSEVDPTKADHSIRALRLVLAIWSALLPWYPFALSAQQTVPSSLSNSRPGDKESLGGSLACRSCHEDIVSSYLTTAHHRTSRLPEAGSIAGSFARGENTMKTFNPELTFLMEARDDRFYESAIRRRNGHAAKHTAQIDLVIGSATKGQTYLYWKQNGLFELPVSYWTQLRKWVNSPGYVDGSADFDRPVLPRCLECHTTYFQPITSSPAENHYNRDNVSLGISCERCHGPGTEHVKTRSISVSSVERTRMPPLGLNRERQIDVCAQCHGGAGEPIAPAFAFLPGEKLSEYIRLQPATATDRMDVHGNQALLLERSRCFQASPQMSCSTCHDVHAPERPAADYSARCLDCHRATQCGTFAKAGNSIRSRCVDCHMPVQASNTLVLDADDTRLHANVRTHWIRVYPNPTHP